jgi:alpha-N-arabinofuranosidase
VDGPLSLELDARGLRITSATTLTDPDVYARNTVDDPDRVSPRPNENVEQDPMRVLLPPVSWNVIHLA